MVDDQAQVATSNPTNVESTRPMRAAPDGLHHSSVRSFRGPGAEPEYAKQTQSGDLAIRSRELAAPNKANWLNAK